MYMPHFIFPFVIHSSVDGHLDYFYLLGIFNSAAMHMGVKIPVQVPLSVLLGVYAEVELLEPAYYFPQWKLHDFLKVAYIQHIFKVRF